MPDLANIPDFTIVGAGPVGTLMAVLLARRGARVQLIERRSDPRMCTPERGRSINLALAARGLVALEQAHLIPRIAPHWVSMPGRMLHTEGGQLRFLPYGSRDSEVLYSISREQLNQLLIEVAAEHAGIELDFDSRCVDVEPTSRTLQIRDEACGRERSVPFRTLLGADGAGSAVRAALQRRGLTQAREEPLAHDYKELSIAAQRAGHHAGSPSHVAGSTAPAGSNPHVAGSAAPAFEPHALHIWPREAYMLIALPNADGSFTATLFLARHGDPGFERLGTDVAVRRFFAQQFADAAERIPDLERQFAEHPQSRLATLHCERWGWQDAVLLIGDAAHAIVPFHGQGLNCGFEDCRLLEPLLAAQADRAAALEQFERARRPDAAAIATMALENYLEMRSAVRTPEFAARRRLAAQLERAFPERFIPRYSLVMFHPEMGYAQARERGARTRQLLDALGARCGIGPLEGERLACARTLLDQLGL